MHSEKECPLLNYSRLNRTQTRIYQTLNIKEKIPHPNQSDIIIGAPSIIRFVTDDLFDANYDPLLLEIRSASFYRKESNEATATKQSEEYINERIRLPVYS